jgi:hypothetical protein
VSFPIRNEQFFARSRKSRNYTEAYEEHAAQGIPKLDTEIAASGSERKGPFLDGNQLRYGVDLIYFGIAPSMVICFQINHITSCSQFSQNLTQISLINLFSPFV